MVSPQRRERPGTAQRLVRGQLKNVEQLIKEGELEQAEKALSGLQAQYGQFPNVHIARAGLHVRQREYADAEQCLSQALGLEPESSAALTLQAQVAENLGDAQRAIELFHAALAVNPRLIRPRLACSRLLIASENLADAESMLCEALRFNPQSLEAAVALCRVLESDGRPQEALDTIENALIRAPRAAILYTLKAKIAATSGRAEDALKLLLESIELDPTLAISHFLLGDLYCAHAQYDLALPEYRSAISHAPEFGNRHPELGAILSSDDCTETVVRNFGRAYAEVRKQRDIDHQDDMAHTAAADHDSNS